jgi:acyl-CoA synthetase (AMP-forming)/AMP-acid ligase II/acyl carrier protein
VLAAGGSIVCTAGFDAARFGEWLDEFAPTFLAGSPAVIDAALVAWTRQPPARSSLRFILSGSTALKPALQDEAERVLGIPIIQGLASAETGVVAQNPLPPGRRVPGSVGVPCGCEVAIVDSEWRQVAQGHEGSIAVRGPEVFEGYEQDPEANRSAFRDGWFRTGDIGYFDADGYLFLTGRARELVNRGGFKVAPVEVDEVLLRHPDVADAAAFGVPHRTLGEDVVAVVTLRAGSDVEAAALRELLLASLAPYKVPSEIRVVTEIPRTALGKVRRTELAERFEAARRGAGPGGAEGPLDSVEEIVAACFSEVLQRPVTDRTASFYAEGGDSLQGTRVITRVNAAFGLALTPTDLLQRPTIAALADQVRAARSATVSEAASAPPALVPVTRRERLRTTRGTERSEAR